MYFVLVYTCALLFPSLYIIVTINGLAVVSAYSPGIKHHIAVFTFLATVLIKDGIYLAIVLTHMVSVSHTLSHTF